VCVEFLTQVLQEADVVVTTLAGAATLSTPRLFPVLATSLASAAKAVGKNRGGNVAKVPGAMIPQSLLAPALRFDAILVDEAGQSTEPEVLIPLRHAFTGHVIDAGAAGRSAHSSSAASAAAAASLGLPTPRPGGGWGSIPPWSARSACCRLVLVGDPLQLPATVLSRSAASAGLEVSLFERLSASGLTPLLLRTQYRMHAAISAFSNAHFYRGLVRDARTTSTAPSVDAESLSALPHLSSPHATASAALQRGLSSASGKPHSAVVGSSAFDPCAAPLVVVDVPWGVESRRRGGGSSAGATSWGNDAEVAAIVALLEHINSGFDSSYTGPAIQAGLSGRKRPREVACSSNSVYGSPLSVGVITPYSEQAWRIRTAIAETLGLSIEGNRASGASASEDTSGGGHDAGSESCTATGSGMSAAQASGSRASSAAASAAAGSGKISSRTGRIGRLQVSTVDSFQVSYAPLLVVRYAAA
jgi:hypothetical protein